jgi:hypothetical protein
MRCNCCFFLNDFLYRQMIGYIHHFNAYFGTPGAVVKVPRPPEDTIFSQYMRSGPYGHIIMLHGAQNIYCLGHNWHLVSNWTMTSLLKKKS